MGQALQRRRKGQAEPCTIGTFNDCTLVSSVALRGSRGGPFSVLMKGVAAMQPSLPRW